MEQSNRFQNLSSTPHRTPRLNLPLVQSNWTPRRTPEEFPLPHGIRNMRRIGPSRNVFHLMSPEGDVVGVRKMAFNGNLTFNAAHNELSVYKTLLERVGRDALFEHVVKFKMSNSPDKSTLIMDFDWVDGCILGEKLLRSTKLEKLTLFRKCAEVLIWLWDQGFTHGDIKSDNFWVSKDNKVLLLDFGKSKERGRQSTDVRKFKSMIEAFLPRFGHQLEISHMNRVFFESVIAQIDEQLARADETPDDGPGDMVETTRANRFVGGGVHWNTRRRVRLIPRVGRGRPVRHLHRSRTLRKNLKGK